MLRFAFIPVMALVLVGCGDEPGTTCGRDTSETEYQCGHQDGLDDENANMCQFIELNYPITHSRLEYDRKC